MSCTRTANGVLCLAVLAGFLITAANARLPAQEQKLRPELALVPPEAFLFAHLRPADLWQSEPGAALRKQFSLPAAAAQIELGKMLGTDPADMESFSLVLPTVMAFDSFSRPKARGKKAFAEPKGAPAPAPDPPPLKPKDDKDCGAKEEAIPGMPAEHGVAMILTTVKPCDRAKVLLALLAGEIEEAKHDGKTYHFSKQPFERRYVAFLNERTYLTGSSLSLLKQLLARPAQVAAQGTQAKALASAMSNYPLVVGLNLTEPSAEGLKKEVERDWTRPWQRDGIWVALPLLKMRSAMLRGDLRKENKVVLQAELNFANATQAAEATEAAQDVLTLIRILGVGQMRQGLRYGMENTDNTREPLFGLQLLKQVEKALRNASVQQRESAVHLQAVEAFDLAAMSKEANREADALLNNESYQRARQRRLSMNNLKQIGLALFNFYDANKELPPAAICSKTDGKPLLSWRVAILPYVDEVLLYQEFKLDEPWDSPHNLKLLPRMPKVYAPTGVKTKEPHATFYQAFVGPGAAFETHPDMNNYLGARSKVTLIGMTDGTSNTIGVAEALDPVPWTKPADLAYDADKPLPKVGGQFKDGFHALFMDATVRYLSKRIDEQALRALITRSGNEAVDYWKYELR